MAAVARQLCKSTPGKRAEYCQPVAFIIAAIVAPTAIKPPGQEFDGGRRPFSMRHSGEMSSTHHRFDILRR